MKVEVLEVVRLIRRLFFSLGEENEFGLVVEIFRKLVKVIWRRFRVGLWDKNIFRMDFLRIYRVIAIEVGSEFRSFVFLNGVVWLERYEFKL